MAKGSVGKTKNENNKDRAFYTLTLNTKNPDDLKKIEYLANRSTTEVLKKGMDLLMAEEKQGEVNEQILQLLQNASGSNQLIMQLLTQILVSVNSNGGQPINVNVPDLLSQTNIPKANNEQAATTEVKEEVVAVEKFEMKEDLKKESEPELAEEDENYLKAKKKAEDAMKKLPF